MTLIVEHAFHSTKPVGPDSGKVNSDDWNDPHVVTGGLPSPHFGTGLEGDVNFDGTATVLGYAPTTIGAFKVYTLDRCIYPNSITIGSGVKLFTANYRVFCKTSITGAGSTVSFIHNEGNPAPVAVTTAPSPVAATATPTGYFGATIAGNVGSIASSSLPPFPWYTTSVGGAPGGATGFIPADGHTGTTPGLGGGGGSGTDGIGGHNNGIAGGPLSVVGPGAGYGFNEQVSDRPSGSAGSAYSGATGGGNGAPAPARTQTVYNVYSTPGGGGAGGGTILVAADTITGVTISARGGRGADGLIGTPADDAAASGGGGGGGGRAIVIYNHRSDAPVDVRGGDGGIPATPTAFGSTTLAGHGGAGSDGHAFLYNLSADGT